MGLLLLDMTQLGEATLPFGPSEIIMGKMGENALFPSKLKPTCPLLPWRTCNPWVFVKRRSHLKVLKVGPDAEDSFAEMMVMYGGQVQSQRWRGGGCRGRGLWLVHKGTGLLLMLLLLFSLKGLSTFSLIDLNGQCFSKSALVSRDQTSQLFSLGWRGWLELQNTNWYWVLALCSLASQLYQSHFVPLCLCHPTFQLSTLFPLVMGFQ